MPWANDSINIIRRPVKHARLRVLENSRVELIVPTDFTEYQVDSLLAKKRDWIGRQQEFFQSFPATLSSADDSDLVLFGGSFRFIHAPELRHHFQVDES